MYPILVDTIARVVEFSRHDSLERYWYFMYRAGASPVARTSYTKINLR